jgi:hypothetical protein
LYVRGMSASCTCHYRLNIFFVILSIPWGINDCLSVSSQMFWIDWWQPHWPSWLFFLTRRSLLYVNFFSAIVISFCVMPLINLLIAAISTILIWLILSGLLFFRVHSRIYSRIYSWGQFLILFFFVDLRKVSRLS